MNDALTIRIVFLWLLCGVQLGCPSGRESLHELDHEKPAHWPENPGAAADAIERRVERLATGNADFPALKELRELVEWSPEIAADTDLAERHWQPIHELSERVRSGWRGTNESMSSSREELLKLATLLREAQQRLTSDQPGTTDEHHN